MKKLSCLMILLIILLGAGCQEKLSKKGTTLSLSEADSKVIREAEKLGREIFENDQYAARASDLLMEKIADPASMGILGWITTKTGDMFIVLFVAKEENTFVSPCRVEFNGSKKSEFIQENRPLSDTEVAMFRARQLWPDIIERRCTEDYNTVVLPSEDFGWLLYVLAATTDLNSVVVGGHYKATVSADGRNILSKRGFTKTCMTFPTDKPGLTAYYMTHVLDNTPTEIHVFLSLLSHKDFFVMTPDGRSWIIHGDKIQLVKSGK